MHVKHVNSAVVGLKSGYQNSAGQESGALTKLTWEDRNNRRYCQLRQRYVGRVVYGNLHSI